MTYPAGAAPLQPYGTGAGYVDASSPANPAAGAGKTIQLDPTFVDRPLSLRFSLSTDANVANRFVSVDYTDPEGNVYVRNAPGLVVTASTTGQVFDFNAQRATSEWATNTDIMAPLADFFLPPSWQIRIAIANVQAGDQISAIRFFRERWVTGQRGGRGGQGYGGFPIPAPR